MTTDIDTIRAALAYLDYIAICRIGRADQKTMERARTKSAAASRALTRLEMALAAANEENEPEQNGVGVA